ncbi:MAG TPA: hypothetical protein VN922_13555 [Bacteroidia bacterium]|nr:hypothetical protein [Bacteroidia bacterium]
MKKKTLAIFSVWLIAFIIAILIHWLNGDDLLVRGPILGKALTDSGICAFIAAGFYWLVFLLD